MNRSGWVIAIGIVLGLVVRAHAAALPVGLGQTAPDFTLGLLDGRQVTLKDFRGTAVVLNFWQSG